MLDRHSCIAKCKFGMPNLNVMIKCIICSVSLVTSGVGLKRWSLLDLRGGFLSVVSSFFADSVRGSPFL